MKPGRRSREQLDRQGARVKSEFDRPTPTGATPLLLCLLNLLGNRHFHGHAFAQSAAANTGNGGG